MNVFVLEKKFIDGSVETLRISDFSTDIFVNGVFKKSFSTLFGSARKSARVHLQNGYKVLN